MNVPIPPIFLYEVSYSKYEVMDGLQRLTAISQFYKNEFVLEGLEEWPELNGLSFQDMPDQIKRGIDRRYLSSIILLQETAKSDEEAIRMKQMVFERINSGGVKLSPQETRNALYPGKLNNLCIELARYEPFCKMWNIPTQTEEQQDPDKLTENSLYSNMQDVELVLRFFAYRQIESWENPSLTLFLDEFLKKGNEFDDSVLEEYEQIFKKTVDLLYSLFEEKSFWLNRKRKGDWILYERATKVLYDPLMYVMSDLLEFKDDLLKNKDTINSEVKSLHTKNEDTLGGRNTNRNDVLSRINILSEFYQNYIPNE